MASPLLPSRKPLLPALSQQPHYYTINLVNLGLGPKKGDIVTWADVMDRLPVCGWEAGRQAGSGGVEHHLGQVTLAG